MKNYPHNINCSIGMCLLIIGGLCLVLAIWFPLFVQIVFGVFTGAFVFYFFGLFSHKNETPNHSMESKNEME